MSSVPSVVNEFRGGFFRNRNDSSPVAYFTNAEFGIANPLDSKVPDLTQLDIRGDRDVGGRVRFGTPADGTRIYDLQTTYTIGDTLTLTKGSIRSGRVVNCGATIWTATFARGRTAVTTSGAGSTS